MSYSEFIEWVAYLRLESSGGSPSVPQWQKMTQSMRLVTELQKAKAFHTLYGFSPRTPAGQA